MPKHTPGPWKVVVVDHGDLKQVETIEASVPFGKGAFRVTVPGAISGRTCDECDANANLIAAAPELLEVVKLAESLADEELIVGQVSNERIANLQKIARAAIAKAIGE